MSTNVVDLDAARDEQMFHRTVAANVRAETARASVTQKQIATAIGKTQQVVSSKMRGHTPFSLNELATIAPMVGLTVVELIAGVHPLGLEPRTQCFRTHPPAEACEDCSADVVELEAYRERSAS